MIALGSSERNRIARPICRAERYTIAQDIELPSIIDRNWKTSWAQRHAIAPSTWVWHWFIMILSHRDRNGMTRSSNRMRRHMITHKFDLYRLIWSSLKLILLEVFIHPYTFSQIEELSFQLIPTQYRLCERVTTQLVLTETRI